MATLTHKVKPGETLSQIAQKYGVKISDISGYRSGNPNLIYSGETLTINPSPTPETRASQIEALQKKIATVKEEIRKRREAIQKVQEAGIPPTEEIPTEILESAGLTPTTTTIDTTDTEAIVSSFGQTMADVQEAIRQNIEQFQKSLATQRKQTQTFFQEMTQKLKGITEEKPLPQDIFTKTLQQYGITPETFQQQQDLINKIAAKNKEIARIDVKYETKKARETQLGMPQEYITRRERYYDRLAAIEKAGLAAEAEALAAQYEATRGNIDLATSFAERAANYAVQEYQMRLDDFKTLFTLKSEMLDSLSEDERKIWELAYDYNRDMLNLKREEARDKYSLIVDAAAKGIQLPTNLSYEETLKLYSERVATIPEEEEYAPTQYKREWEEAGGLAGTGMSLADWIKYRTGIMEITPREWTDEEFRIAIRKMQAEEKTYQEVLDEIALDATIANKDRARLIAAELYGEEIPTPSTPLTPEEKKRIEEMQKLTLEIPPVSETLPESTIPLFE